MSLQFISCTDTTCPMNKMKQCRAPWIFVDKDGRCSIREGGPHENKSDVEAYVDLKTCDCSSCNNWETNVDGKGVCGFSGTLFFNPKNICNEFEKQIGEPGFAKVVF